MSADKLAAIALCCHTSARMLEIADEIVPEDEAGRAIRREYNCKQALLLREAAQMAANMAAELRPVASEAA